jgi:hypothetical protein
MDKGETTPLLIANTLVLLVVSIRHMADALLPADKPETVIFKEEIENALHKAEQLRDALNP